MFKSMKSKLVALTGAIVGAFGLVGQATASALPATLAADMASTQTDIITVGGLIIGLAVVALGIRWVKATFF